MKITRKIILRNETTERIILYPTSKKRRRESFQDETYQLKIIKINGKDKKIVFETTVFGLIEIRETVDEIQIVLQKQ